MQRPSSEMVAKPITMAQWIQESSVVLGKSGLIFRRIPTYQKWESIGRQIISVGDSSTWWIADWLAYGETTFQDRYREAIQRTSLNYQTLRNYAWVARRFDLPRRREALSFGHHAEVAGLEQPEQDFWLRKAEELGWSRNKLRSQVRTSLRERGNHKTDDEGIGGQRQVGGTLSTSPENGIALDICLPVTSDQLTRFTEVASSQKKGLEEWALDVLDSASQCSIFLNVRNLLWRGTGSQYSDNS